VARALVARGAAPVLAHGRVTVWTRSPRISRGLETQVADVSDPEAVRALVERGDVLISTVGRSPAGRDRDPGGDRHGATYFDTTGEPTFIRGVFERYGPEAARARTALLTAFGYDFVPGTSRPSSSFARPGRR